MMAHYHYEVVYGTRDGKRHLIGGELTPPRVACCGFLK